MQNKRAAMQNTGRMPPLRWETGTHTTHYFRQQIALFKAEDLSQIRQSQEDSLHAELNQFVLWIFLEPSFRLEKLHEDLHQPSILNLKVHFLQNPSQPSPISKNNNTAIMLFPWDHDGDLPVPCSPQESRHSNQVFCPALGHTFPSPVWLPKKAKGSLTS